MNGGTDWWNLVKDDIRVLPDYDIRDIMMLRTVMCLLGLINLNTRNTSEIRSRLIDYRIVDENGYTFFITDIEMNEFKRKRIAIVFHDNTFTVECSHQLCEDKYDENGDRYPKGEDPHFVPDVLLLPDGHFLMLNSGQIDYINDIRKLCAFVCA
jgi:hypothetical protein